MDATTLARNILAVLREHEDLSCEGEDYCLLFDAIKAQIGQDCPEVDVETILTGNRVVVYMTKDGTKAFMFKAGQGRVGFTIGRDQATVMDTVAAAEWVQSLTDQQKNPAITYGTDPA